YILYKHILILYDEIPVSSNRTSKLQKLAPILSATKAIKHGYYLIYNTITVDTSSTTAQNNPMRHFSSYTYK
ncbi:hypothetical protein, partial [Veillonella sp.]|uniref:hypothetical protein n=1 Tax=Veillonella sp. TaxID=1926307 RepID=UPI0025D2DC3B